MTTFINAETDISTVSATALAALTPVELKSLTPTQLGALSPVQLSEFSALSVSMLPLKFISPLILTGISTAEISGLAIKNLSISQVAALLPTQISALTPQQVAAFQFAQFNALTVAQTSALSSVQAAEIKESTLSNVDNSHIAALSPAFLTGLSAKAFASLTTTQISALTTAQFAALTTEQQAVLSDMGFTVLPSTNLKLIDFSTLPTSEILKLTALQIATLTPQQIGGFTSEQIAALSSTQSAALQAQQIAKLSADKATQLTPSAIAALNPLVMKTLKLNAFSSADVTAFSNLQAAYLTFDNVAQLNSTNANGLTATQLGVIKLNSLKSLTLEAVPHLTTDAAAALTSSQLARFSTGQLEAFTHTQVAHFSTTTKNWVVGQNFAMISGTTMTGSGIDTTRTTINNIIDLSADSHATSTAVIDLPATISMTVKGIAVGSNTITGGSCDDTISGGDGNDSIVGSLGNDMLTGGIGSDTIIGGDGNNVYQYAAGDSTVTAIDTLTGTFNGYSNDVLKFTGAVGMFSVLPSQAISALTETALNLALNSISGSLTNHFKGSNNTTIAPITNAGKTFWAIDLNGDGVFTAASDLLIDVTSSTTEIATVETFGVRLPTLSAISTVTNATEDTEKLISFSDLVGLADENDAIDIYGRNGISAFVVKSVNSGTLKIGTDSASSATAISWAAGSNDIIDTTHFAFWIPASNANGVLNAFLVVAKDNEGYESLTPISVNVNATAVNDAPTATNLDVTESYTRNTPLNLVDIVVDDVDSANITATLTLSNGSLVSGGITSNNGVWTASGSIATVNTLLENLTFTPATNFTGNVTITSSISDGSLAVTSVKDLRNTVFTLNEDTTYTFTAGNFGYVGGSTMSKIKITSLPASGSLKLSENTVTVNQEIPVTSIANLTYTPVANANGENYSHFTFTTNNATSTSAGAYADYVIGYSSQWSPTSWAATQALGASTTFGYGDISTSWSPQPTQSSLAGGIEYITVGFNTPVYAIGAVIRETYGNGFVSQIEAIDENNGYHSVWNGTDTSPQGLPIDFLATWAETSYLVKGLKISVNTLNFSSWEELDSIKLLNASGGLTNTAAFDVTPVNDSPTGNVTITDTAIQNQTLSINTSGLGDVDGLGAFSYQWKKTVSGTTSNINVPTTQSSLPLTQAEVGAQISVTISYVDGGGTSENVTSAATSAVVDVNDAPVFTSGATASVNENTVISTVVYTATATDAENNAITYSLSGTDASYLNIDTSTGVVTLKNPANYEAKNSYNFTVDLSENSVASGVTKAILVSVIDVIEAPILNGSFEAPGVPTGNENILSTTIGVVNNWTYTATTFKSGLTNQNLVWLASPPPDGNVAAFIQGQSSISQTVNFAAQGTYQINFKAIGRTDTENLAVTGSNSIDVKMDNITIGTISAASISTSAWGDFSASYTASTVGNHTLTFAGVSSADLTTIIDKVSIATISDNGTFYNPVNGHYYSLTTAATWQGAETQAIAMGGHLVTVNDAAENAWLATNFPRVALSPYWIGLNDAAVEGSMVWSSGEISTNWSSWWAASPSNADEDYVTTNWDTTGTWNDVQNTQGSYKGIIEIVGTV